MSRGRKRALSDEQERKREAVQRVEQALKSEREEQDRAFSEALEEWKERSTAVGE